MSGRQYRYTLIRDTRLERHLGVSEAARAVGVDRSTWWEMENGKRASLKLIGKACAMLGLNWRDVVTMPT
jgi:DNA-binding XRE family transcriptional regulator